MSNSILNEAYERLRHAGPEWGEDQLTNHGPMAVEVLVRRGHASEVHRWVDAYVRRLDDLPRASEQITEQTWQAALGDGRRIGDWTDYFARQLDEQPWPDVLAAWWSRLLPGIVAGTTRRYPGWPRVTSAAGGWDVPASVHELANGLAFWAARAQAVPSLTAPLGGDLDPRAAVDAAPRFPDQRGTVATRFGQLGRLAGWPGSVAALRPPADPDDARTLLIDLVTASALRYLSQDAPARCCWYTRLRRPTPCCTRCRHSPASCGLRA